MKAFPTFKQFEETFSSLNPQDSLAASLHLLIPTDEIFERLDDGARWRGGVVKYESLEQVYSFVKGRIFEGDDFLDLELPVEELIKINVSGSRKMVTGLVELFSLPMIVGDAEINDKVFKNASRLLLVDELREVIEHDGVCFKIDKTNKLVKIHASPSAVKSLQVVDVDASLGQALAEENQAVFMGSIFLGEDEGIETHELFFETQGHRLTVEVRKNPFSVNVGESKSELLPMETSSPLEGWTVAGWDRWSNKLVLENDVSGLTGKLDQ